MPDRLIESLSVRGSSHRLLLFWRLSPMQAILLSFLALILVGAVLLSLPIAHQYYEPSSVLDYLATATAAACLVGVPGFQNWTGFGQVVIVLLVQFGAIGYMSAVMLIAQSLGIRMGAPVSPAVQDGGVITTRDAWRILRMVTLYTLIIEAVGALLIAVRLMIGNYHTFGGALIQGALLSIGAFCNTALQPLLSVWSFSTIGSLSYHHDLWLLGLLGLLALLGGLGIGVLREMRRPRRMSLHAKVALFSTLLLLVVGAGLFYLFEMRHALAMLPDGWHRAGTALFMSISARSSGYEAISISQLNPPTLLVLGLLSLAGGAPGGTAGGVKVTTLAVIVLAIFSLVRHRPDIEVFRRRISGHLVRLALSVVSFYLLFLLLLVLAVSFTEFALAPHGGMDPYREFTFTLFKVVFSYASVGWAGIGGLHPVSQALLIFGMFFGRLGTLMLVAFFAGSQQLQLRRLPEEAVMAG